MMLMRCFLCFILIFFIKPYIVRQVDAIQMGTHNICLYKNVDKKYTGYNLKNTELLDCSLIGVCAVIRSKTVLYYSKFFFIILFFLHHCNYHSFSLAL